MHGIGILILCFTIASAFAEPPRYRQRNQFARQEIEATTETAEDTTEQKGGPYAPSGWKPTGQRLTLPARQQSEIPNTVYGPPKQQYGPPPATAYGPPSEGGEPESTTATNPSDGSEGNEITEEPESENVNLDKVPAQQTAAVQPQQGLYYVQLADGSLQQVLYYTAPTLNGIVNARLQVQPVLRAQPVLQAQPVLNQVIVPGQAYTYSQQYQSW